MELQVKILNDVTELTKAVPFRIDKLLWGTKSIPDTYGYIGFVPGDGFYLKMTCEETDPLRTYTEYQDPVCLDSAMEAFFMFHGNADSGTAPVYLNLEANANGALLAQYGPERNGRTSFPEEDRKEFCCGAESAGDCWTLELRVPLTILERLYGPLDLKKGSRFTCNFYKISETKSTEHYASFSPVRSENPDFHRPEDFADAVIV